MENCPFIVELASLIIVGGFIGVVSAMIGDGIKGFIKKRRERKEDSSHE